MLREIAVVLIVVGYFWGFTAALLPPLWAQTMASVSGLFVGAGVLILWELTDL